jgi:predicted Kef-type K+ transport protein
MQERILANIRAGNVLGWLAIEKIAAVLDLDAIAPAFVQLWRVSRNDSPTIEAPLSRITP